MLKIGITGGIGSGKSVVCRIFETCGAPVYDADSAAKRLMQEDSPLKEKILSYFGNIYDTTGLLLRSQLAEKVFGNAENLQKLNSLVHPVVMADYTLWEDQQTYTYVIRESAILFESKTNGGLDHVILVEAPESLRIKRIIKRDQRTEKQIREIINNQMPDEKKKRTCRFCNY